MSFRMTAMTQGRTGKEEGKADAGGAGVALTGRGEGLRGIAGDEGVDALTGGRTPLTLGTSGGRGEVLRLAYPDRARRTFGHAAPEDAGKGVVLALAVFAAIFLVALALGCDAFALSPECPAKADAAARGE